jgi:hypothetical protein
MLIPFGFLKKNTKGFHIVQMKFILSLSLKVLVKSDFELKGVILAYLKS